MHRDLKPENLLLSDQSEYASLKIADFGLSAVVFASAASVDHTGTPTSAGAAGNVGSGGASGASPATDGGGANEWYTARGLAGRDLDAPGGDFGARAPHHPHSHSCAQLPGGGDDENDSEDGRRPDSSSPSPSTVFSAPFGGRSTPPPQRPRSNASGPHTHTGSGSAGSDQSRGQGYHLGPPLATSNNHCLAGGSGDFSGPGSRTSTPPAPLRRLRSVVG